MKAETASDNRDTDARNRRGPYRKGEQKRREILLAAIDVFSRRGYRNASIREIGESVGLTQAGILHYFASKEKLFVEVLRVRDEIDEARADDILETFRLVIQHNAEVEGLVHLFVTVSAEATDEAHPGHEFFRSRYDRLIELLRDRIKAGQDDGSLYKAVSPEMAARMLVAVADGIQIQWLLDPDHTDMLATFDAIWQAMLMPGRGGRADGG
jgi:AcrR family transcriptional regulator